MSRNNHHRKIVVKAFKDLLVEIHKTRNLKNLNDFDLPKKISDSQLLKSNLKFFEKTLNELKKEYPIIKNEIKIEYIDRDSILVRNFERPKKNFWGKEIQPEKKYKDKKIKVEIYNPNLFFVYQHQLSQNKKVFITHFYKYLYEQSTMTFKNNDMYFAKMEDFGNEKFRRKYDLVYNLGTMHNFIEHIIDKKNINFSRVCFDQIGPNLTARELKKDIKDFPKASLMKYELESKKLPSETNELFELLSDQKIYEKVNSIFNSFVEEEANNIITQESNRKEKLQKNKDSFFSEFDKNGNGEIDILEEKGFDNFLKGNQKAILDIDRNLIQDFVKLSKFLKDKQANLVKVFSLIRNAKTNSSIKDFKETFEVQHFSYCVSLFEAYRMLLALIQDDMITFYEIHDEFESMRVFEAQWQKDLNAMRNDLSEIKQLNKATLQTLLVISSQIRQMEISMIKGFNMINSTLEIGFNSINENLNLINDSINVMNKSLTKELKGINNKLWWNNLFQVVQIYQNRKRYNQLNKLIKK